MNRFMNNDEYISQGKECTAKALKDLQKQLIDKEISLKKNENKFEETDSDTEDNSNMNFTFLDNDVISEINSFRSPTQIQPQSNNTVSSDRILQIFNNLINRNNKLLNLNNKLSNNIKRLRRDILELEGKSHTDKVFNNSITIEKDDLVDKNKALLISLKEKTTELKNINRSYYICRFIIGFLSVLSMFLFVNQQLRN